MTLKIAKRVIVAMIALGIGIALLSIFVDKDYVGAIIGISSASTFYFVHRNPKLMMTKTWDEFGEEFDNSRDKKYIGGSPALNAVMLGAILYIWLV
jgi:hypothetical protein